MDTEAELYQKHQGLIYFVLHPFGFVSLAHTDPMTDYDDLVQEGSIGLLCAIREYDPSHGATFSSFAVKVIENQLLKLVYKKNQRPPSVSLDTPIGEDEDGDTFEDIVGDIDPAFDAVAAKLLWRKLSEKLSKRDRDIFLSRVVEGATLEEVGKRYDLTGERIRQKYNAILEHLRNQFA